MLKGPVRMYIESNKDVVIQYVRDSMGFKKGVVVGIDKNHIGWSLVNKEDYEWKDLRFDQLPRVQRHMHLYGEDSITLGDMMHDPDYKKLCEVGGILQVPTFDKEEGLWRALRRAFNVPLYTLGKYVQVANIPNDPELRRAVTMVEERLTE